MSGWQYGPWQIKIITDATGYVPTAQSVMLDFGCGRGTQLSELRGMGYQVFGCDIEFSQTPDAALQQYLADGIIRQTESDPYRIPFPDNTFDVVFSKVVLEHVMDYAPVLKEIARVLKPGGCALHVFPGKYAPKESHVYVPFASLIQARWWLRLWAQAGIRNEFQQGLNAAETTRLNYEYLHSHTNYLTRRQILDYARVDYAEARFAEDTYFNQYPTVIRPFRFLYGWYRNLYSDFNMRTLVCRKAWETQIDPVKPRGMMIIHLFRPIIGGAELQAERLAIQLAKRGHSMQVLTNYRDSASSYEERRDGMAIHRTPFHLAYQITTAVKETFRYLVHNRKSYDILHAHMMFGHAVVAVVVARFFRKKCLIKIACAGEYGDLALFSTFDGFERARKVLGQADAFVAISREVEEELIRYGFPREKIQRIPNGVDSDFFKRTLPFPPREQFRFILIGRRGPQKGIDIALQALKLLEQYGADLPFKLAMHGVEYPEHDYSRLADELGVAHLVEFNPVEPKIKDVYHSAHCFILPSRGEGLSNSLLEAMAMELPVIATKVSGTEDVLRDEENGLLISAESAEALANAMARVMRDPELAQRLGRGARQTIERLYSLESVAERYSQLYQRLWSGK